MDSPEQYKESEMRHLAQQMVSNPPFIALIKSLVCGSTDYGYGAQYVKKEYINCDTEAAARELNPAAIYKLI